MGKGILERTLKDRADIKELMETLQEIDEFANSLKDKQNDKVDEIIDTWKKFVRYIKEDIPLNIKNHILNTIPHVISLISELKTRSDIKNGTIEVKHLSKRVGGWDRHSFLTSRLIDISVQIGADLNSKQAGIPFKSLGVPSTHYASFINNYNCLSTLVNRGADIECTCSKENSPLHYAFSNDKSLYVKKGTKNEDVLREYYRMNSRKIKNFLIEKIKDINVKGNSGNTVIHVISNNKHFNDFESFNLLINKGVDLNVVNKKGNTAMHTAAINGNIELIEYFIHKNANPNVQNNEGKTPLHFAYLYTKTRNVDKLIALGCDPSIKDKYGNRPKDYLDRDDNYEKRDTLNTNSKIKLLLNRSRETIQAYI